LVRFLNLLGPAVETVGKLVCSLHQVLSFIFQDEDSLTLSVAVMLDLGQLGAALIDGLLMLVSEILLLIDAVSQVFFFALELLNT
jgi:hypothetical protein